MGTGPHPSDPRAVAAAAEIIELIDGRRRGSGAEHVGRTAVPISVGKDFVDLQIERLPSSGRASPPEDGAAPESSCYEDCSVPRSAP